VESLFWKKETVMQKDERRNASKRFNRREFLKTLAASGGMVAAGSLLTGCGASGRSPSGGGSGGGVVLDLTQPENQSLASVGGTLAIEAAAIDPKGLLLVRAGENSVLAYSRSCTHQGCTLGEYRNGVASCPCHGSQFDTGGNPVKGPAQKPLKAYTATLSGSTVTVTE
jgi:cytochrome b6-f complex iron-sulfur subunit